MKLKIFHYLKKKKIFFIENVNDKILELIKEILKN